MSRLGWECCGTITRRRAVLPHGVVEYRAATNEKPRALRVLASPAVLRKPYSPDDRAKIIRAQFKRRLGIIQG